MLFIENKYTAWYNSIVNFAQDRTLPADIYAEVHHIIPKSLKGTNAKKNLVKLTGREHFICHWLLVKMVNTDRHRASMRYALFRMTHRNDSTTTDRHKLNSKQYELVRKHLAEAARYTHTGKKDSIETRKRKSVALMGRPSPTKGMVAWNRGIPATKEAREKASKKLKGMVPWNKGIPASEESNRKRRETQGGISKEKVVCPYCNKVGGKPVMVRFHFDRCKFFC